MWDSMNEYDYKQLKAGEWHIPFGDKFDEERLTKLAIATRGCGTERNIEESLENMKIEIATARCARVSYNNFEGKDDYEADIDLYHSLFTRPYTNKKGQVFTESDPKHMSPSEHCARAMTHDEFFTHSHNKGIQKEEVRELGWSGNFRGFVQLRQEL